MAANAETIRLEVEKFKSTVPLVQVMCAQNVQALAGVLV